MTLQEIKQQLANVTDQLNELSIKVNSFEETNIVSSDFVLTKAEMILLVTKLHQLFMDRCTKIINDSNFDEYIDIETDMSYSGRQIEIIPSLDISLVARHIEDEIDLDEEEIIDEVNLIVNNIKSTNI